jgi:hypothetical protein
MKREGLLHRREDVDRKRRSKVSAAKEVSVNWAVDNRERSDRSLVGVGGQYGRIVQVPSASTNRGLGHASNRPRRFGINEANSRCSREEPSDFIGKCRSNLARDQRAPRGHAGLTRVRGETHKHCPRRRARISIRKDDRAIRTRQFERRGNQTSRTDLRNRTANRSRPDENHMVKRLFRNEPLAFATRCWTRLDHSTHRGHGFRRFHRQSDQSRLSLGSPLGRLHNHPVSGQHRLHQLDAEQLHRVVPRRDDKHAP